MKRWAIKWPTCIGTCSRAGTTIPKLTRRFGLVSKGPNMIRLEKKGCKRDRFPGWKSPPAFAKPFENLIMNPLRIGTRGSPLALWQARHVSVLLGAAQPDVALELVEIETVGDQVRDVPLAQLGGDGVFTKAIQQALSGKAR